MTKSDTEKAEVLVKQYSSVFTNETDMIWDLPNNVNQNENIRINFDSITVAKKLNNLSINKSPGLNGINSRILVELGDHIAPSLSIIYQKSFDTATIPSKWKEANITPIFKKGDKKDPENYRPVSLTSILCKVMESIIKDHLLKFLKENDILSNNQFGVLPGQSTILQLLNVMEKWTQTVDVGNHIDVVYCDFMKAFDKVSHIRLIQVMLYYCIPIDIVNWVKDFLRNRMQRVMIRGVPSSWHKVISGVPQGSVLGPILFLIYINTLTEVVQHSDLVLFADDNKLYKEIIRDEDKDLLQIDIDAMHNWTNNSLLLFHPDKCFTMQINSKLKTTYSPAYHMNDRILVNKNELKDLGILIDEHLKFKNHITEKINKANQIMNLIRRTFTYVDKDNFIILYKSLVRPHIEYGNVVWYPFLKADINAIENMQRRATRYVPEVSTLEYGARLVKLDLPTLAYRRFRGSMIETYKILNNLYDEQCANLFFEMKETNTRGHSFSIKTKYSRSNVRRNFFSVRVPNLWNSLPALVVEATSLNIFKNRLDNHCRKKGIMFDMNVDFTDIYSLSVLLKQ